MTVGREVAASRRPRRKSHSVAVFAGLALAVLLAIPSARAQTGGPVKPSGQSAKPAGATNKAAALEKIAKDAEAAKAANRIDEAIALYQKGVALQPGWDDGWWALGSIHYDRDDYPNAREAFKRLTAINADSPAGWAMLGLCEFQTKEYDQSLKHLGRAISLGVDKDQEIARVTRYHFALLLTRSERYEDALRVLALFAQQGVEGPNYVEALGIAALRKPLLPSELPPAELEMVMDAGRTLYDATSRKAGPSTAEFQALAEKYPSQPNVHYLYGSFLLTGDEKAGLAEIQKELTISPGHVPALVTLATQYLTRKDYETAQSYAEKATLADPQSFAAHAVLGRVLTESGSDPVQGIKELEWARKLAPASPQVRIALASAYAKAGRKDDAARERQEFLRLKKEAEAEGTGAQ